MKHCRKCGETKSLEAFSCSSRNRDGRQSSCKACASRWNASPHGRAYYQRHREENADRIRATWETWYAANSTVVKDRARAWAQANPEQRAANRRSWFERNPEKAKEMRRRRHDRRRGATPTAASWRYIIGTLRGDPCSYCGAAMEEADHIEAAVAGGTGEWDNLTAACAPCNRQKRHTPLLLFLLQRAA